MTIKELQYLVFELAENMIDDENIEDIEQHAEKIRDVCSELIYKIEP